jgi:ABC-2 type transport system permease protein
MKALITNTKCELTKLLLKKKYIAITAIGAIICVLRLGGSVLVAKLSGGELVIKSNLIMEMIGFVTQILVPLVVFMAVTDLFASEIQEDTMKAVLMRPITRFKVMTSKALAVLVLSCLVMLAIFAVCFVIQLLSGNSLANAPITLAAYLIDMLPIIALISMAIFINVISKSSTSAMFLCIVAYVAFVYMNMYVSPLGQMFFTAYLQWHKLWLGNIIPIKAMMTNVGILFGSVLIFYVASYIIFDKKDI